MSMNGAQASAFKRRVVSGFVELPIFVGVAVAITFVWGLGRLELLPRMGHRQP